MLCKLVTPPAARVRGLIDGRRDDLQAEDLEAQKHRGLEKCSLLKEQDSVEQG